MAAVAAAASEATSRQLLSAMWREAGQGAADVRRQLQLVPVADGRCLVHAVVWAAQALGEPFDATLLPAAAAVAQV